MRIIHTARLAATKLPQGPCSAAQNEQVTCTVSEQPALVPSPTHLGTSKPNRESVTHSEICCRLKQQQQRNNDKTQHSTAQKKHDMRVHFHLPRCALCSGPHLALILWVLLFAAPALGVTEPALVRRKSLCLCFAGKYNIIIHHQPHTTCSSSIIKQHPHQTSSSTNININVIINQATSSNITIIKHHQASS